MKSLHFLLKGFLQRLKFVKRLSSLIINLSMSEWKVSGENLSWTCLVSRLLSFEHPSVLLFLLLRNAYVKYENPIYPRSEVNANIDTVIQPHLRKLDADTGGMTITICKFFPASSILCTHLSRCSKAKKSTAQGQPYYVTQTSNMY